MWSMMFGACRVMSKRLAKISNGGPGAVFESQRMVSEKMVAAAEAAFIFSTGGTVQKVMSNYRKKIRANDRRLR